MYFMGLDSHLHIDEEATGLQVEQEHLEKLRAEQKEMTLERVVQRLKIDWRPSISAILKQGVKPNVVCDQ